MLSLKATTILTVGLASFLPSETYAFGAGQIPEKASIHGKAYRHGDIDSVIAELTKASPDPAAGHDGSVFGSAQTILSAAATVDGANFSREDVKRVYFGNWLRDYSQAVDVAGLSKLSANTIVSIVSVLGFVNFGSSSGEFQVTPERLGVYLPVEHVDNPKGYAEKVPGRDARVVDPRLRPPVDDEELEIDSRTGMKNYMATENRGWDTSTAYIRRTFRASIDFARRAQGQEGTDLYEAYRLLGSGLHTMEDLLAHSNWCELALRKMGYLEVFPYVGEHVIIDSPNGPAPPLVTGTFGSADFFHTLMVEFSNHMGQSKKAKNTDTSSLIRSILKKLPLGRSSNVAKISEAEEMEAKAEAYQFNAEDMMPVQAQQQIEQLSKWRDELYRDTLKQIGRIPGYKGLVVPFEDALDAFVYKILSCYLTPVLEEMNRAILDAHPTEQYLVFDDPDAHDPSHTLLSKDEFAIILNQPAGRVARVVVKHVVKLMVEAWSNHTQDPDAVIDEILEAFHHPYYNTGHSPVQQDMFEEMGNWLASLGPEGGMFVINALTEENVRAGKNKWP